MSTPRPHRYPQRGLHAGYLYQDLIAALACCDVLARGRGTVAIESGRFQGDPFDDVVALEEPTLRMQVKHREARPELPDDVFANSELAIEALVAARPQDADTFLRLVTTWAPPTEAPAWLGQSDSGPSVTGLDSSRWQLDPSSVWPSSGDPIWPRLRDTDRDEFVAFCRQFVLELGCAPMSAVLADPGPLEQALLNALREQVGVERHPNNRDAVDVAARLLGMTSTARARRQRTFSFREIARELGLQIDRGRISQVYPLDTSRFVDRDGLTESLIAAQAENSHVVLEGPPGAGKSWALEALARELGEEMVVARHYCFLEPGDPYVQGRVALQAMSANLVSEILDDPELDRIGRGIGGDIRDLQVTLAAAADVLIQGSDRKLLLIIDGLDHVARVEVDGGQSRWDPDDFAQALAQLELPEGCSIVIGSQPGPHLDAFRAIGAVVSEVPQFTREETACQLERAGVLDALDSRGRSDQRDPVVDAAYDLAAGNPLYVSFLVQEILELLESQGAVLPSDAMRAISAPPGDLGAYYDYLLEREGESAAGLVADHLAVIDFAVTADDLDEMLPALGRQRIDNALRRLRPVLTSVAGQGGYRIYHESLRRHVVERRSEAGGSMQALLDPVIAWLGARGFYIDARAFRHLLPTLRRAGYADRVFEQMGTDFVSLSVVHFQPHRAVLANIRLGSSLAAERGDLVALSGLSELRRAAHTAYEEKLSDVRAYAEAYVEIFGVEALTEQLLYEEHPVLSKSVGLELCELIDRAGGIAPWRTYMGLKKPSSNVSITPDERFRERVVELRGELRLSDPDEAIARIAELLAGNPEPRLDFLDELAQATFAVLGNEAVDRILEAADSVDPGRLAPFRLIAAETACAEGRRADAETLVGLVVAGGLQPTEAARLHVLGLLPKDFPTRIGEPADVAAAVLSNQHRGELQAVERLRIALPIWAEAGVDLDELRQQFDGPGWYRRWLRFLVDTAHATDSTAVVRALTEAAADTYPFSGQPRASDLYDIRDEIEASFRDAFERVTDDDLPAALDSLTRIARGTTTYLQGMAGGPLTLIPLLRILLSRAQRIPLDDVEAEIRHSWANEFYDSHAEAMLAFAEICERAGDSNRARAAWDEAGRYLAAYGWRKDVTLFGPLEALATCDTRHRDVRVTDRLRRLRPLTDRAVHHTDGAETKHLPGVWFGAFAAASPGAAAESLARTLRQHDPTAYWMHEDALPKAIEAGHGLIPPRLEHLLWRCIPARRRVTERLAAVDALAAVNPERAEEGFLEVAAAADGDFEHDNPEVAEAIDDFASSHGWEAPGVGRVPELRPPARDTSGPPITSADDQPEPDRGPFLTEVDSFLALLSWAQEFSLNPLDSSIDFEALAAEVLKKLERLRASDMQIRVLAQTLARERSFLTRADMLVSLAQHYEARPELAAELYVIAWCAGRGRGGWDLFGGLEQRDLLIAAGECDQARARAALAREVAHVIETDDYAFGMAQRLFEALVTWNDLDTALVCWDRAVDVIEHRLPALGREPSTFLEPGNDLPDDQVAVPFAQLLAACARHPDYERRDAALAGLAELIPTEPALAETMLEFATTADFTYCDLLAVLSVIEESDDAGTRILLGSEELIEGASRSLGFGLQAVAAKLSARLGIAVTSPTMADPPRRAVSWPEIDAALSLDGTGRVETLSGAWSELRRRVAERYWALWDETSRHKHIMESQSEHQFSRSSRWVPPLPLHQWRHELFECALHDTLHAFQRQLFATGRWRPGTDEVLLAMVNPNAAVAAARGRSRTVRPAGLPFAAEISEGDQDLLIVDGGRYSGWTVAGHLEQQVEEVDHFSSGRLSSVSSGLVVPALGSNEELPFSSGRGDFAWHLQGPDSADPQKVTGRLTSWWVQHDRLAWDRGLTLREDVRSQLGLVAAPLPAPFDLLDEAGNLCVVWRRWRMRPFSYDYGPTTPLLAGGALLLSPPTAETLAALVGDTLRLHISIESEELTG